MTAATRTKLTRELEAAIVARLRAGEDWDDIATTLGVRLSMVDRLASVHKLRGMRPRTGQQPVVARTQDEVAEVFAASRLPRGPYYPRPRRWDGQGPDLDWLRRRSCDLGFGHLSEDEQVALCQGCPVRTDCLINALQWGPPFAEPRGGLTSDEQLALYLGAQPREVAA